MTDFGPSTNVPQLNGEAREAAHRRLKVAMLWRPLAVYAISRVVVVTAILIANAVSGRDGLLASLRLWDGDWYLSIAADGYRLPTAPSPQSNVAFFPLLPLSIRAATVLWGGAALPAAIVVVHLYGTALAIILWLLIRHVTDRSVADRGTTLFWFFPGAAVFSMLYSEPVMLTFAAACLYMLLTRRWLMAGAAAALAGMARPTGIVLVACCLWQSALVVRREGNWRALIAPAVAPIGLLAFSAHLWIVVGRPDSWLSMQRAGWGAGIDYGAWILQDLSRLFRNPLALNTDTAMEVFGLGVVILGVILLWRWHPPGVVWVYTIGQLAFILMMSSATAGGTRPRLVMAAFPLIIAIARWLHGWSFAAAVAVSCVLMAASAIVYTTPLWVIP